MELPRNVNGEQDTIYKELLTGFQHDQEKVPATPPFVQKCLDLLVSRLALSTESSPLSHYTSSTDGSLLRSSTDSKNTDFLRSAWWFDDLVTLLTPDSIRILVRSMILQRFDHGVIIRFLIYYQKSRFTTAISYERREITEALIDSLCLLDQNSVSCKLLFGILHVSMNLNLKMSCKNKLESMIGARLDIATLDDILIPSPKGSCYLYDVNLVLRLTKSFLIKKDGRETHIPGMKKVAILIDSYIAEVAPDPYLKPSKFLALVKSIPNTARNSYHKLYHAIDIYLEVHTGLSDNEKLSICRIMNYDKLLTEASNDLTQNNGYPSRCAAVFIESPQINPENLPRVLKGDTPLINSAEVISDYEEKVFEKVVFSEEKVDLVIENEKIRTQLQGMQWRVVELEKDHRKLQVQLSKIMKSRFRSKSYIKSLPRICS